MNTRVLVAFTAFSMLLRAAEGAPLEVARGDKSSQPRQPQIAVDETGASHLVYGVNNSVRYCRLDDQAKSFTAPIELPSFGVLSLGMRRGPRITAVDGKITITAIGGAKGKGQDGNVLAYHSADAGATWAGPTVVNDVADSAREGLHGMCAGSNGNVCCVWLDLRHNKSEVMAAVSVDGGASWSKNVLVYQSPDGSVCECCHPSVAFGMDDTIHVMWRNSLSGNRDMYLATSTDDGATFGKASKLGTGTWQLDACPMDGGAIGWSAANGMHAIWQREGRIFSFATSDLHERDLGEGEQPWLVASSTGVYTVWLKKRGAQALLLLPGGVAPAKLANQAWDPILAASKHGSGPVVAAWESRDESGGYTIMCEVVGK